MITVRLGQLIKKPGLTDKLLITQRTRCHSSRGTARHADASQLHAPSGPAIDALYPLGNTAPATSCVILWSTSTDNRLNQQTPTAALGSRRWSGAARWSIRELNELPHYLQHRWVARVSPLPPFILRQGLQSSRTTCSTGMPQRREKAALVHVHAGEGRAMYRMLAREGQWITSRTTCGADGQRKRASGRKGVPCVGTAATANSKRPCASAVNHHSTPNA